MDSGISRPENLELTESVEEMLWTLFSLWSLADLPIGQIRKGTKWQMTRGGANAIVSDQPPVVEQSREGRE